MWRRRAAGRTTLTARASHIIEARGTLGLLIHNFIYSACHFAKIDPSLASDRSTSQRYFAHHLGSSVGIVETLKNRGVNSILAIH